MTENWRQEESFLLFNLTTEEKNEEASDLHLIPLSLSSVGKVNHFVFSHLFQCQLEGADSLSEKVEDHLKWTTQPETPETM